MDRTQLVASIYHAVGQVTTEWGCKLATSCVMGLAISTHVQLLALFMALVIIDLLTKWAELTKLYLTSYMRIQSGAESRIHKERHHEAPLSRQNLRVHDIYIRRGYLRLTF